jgi:SAM-dependent methyltransferase
VTVDSPHHSGVTRARLRPERYERPLDQEFKAFLGYVMRPGISILDAGSGSRPRVGAHKRPPDVTYVGLDISLDELRKAPAGSYDEVVEADLQDLVPGLEGRFDLVLSWFAFEHLTRLQDAVEAIHRYLRPDGWFIAGLAGRNAAFALGNRLIPEAVAVRLVSWLRNRPREKIFPAHYDQCTASGLSRALAAWDEVHVVPLWRAAHYFDKLVPLQRAYLLYEEWAMSSQRRDLAPYYVVAARRD